MKWFKYHARKLNYILIIAIPILLVGFYAQSILNNTNKTTTVDKVTTTQSVKEEPDLYDSGNNVGFVLSVLDVGQGSCSFIESQGKVMVFDGGDRSTSSKVVSFAKNEGITHIDYLVASHYHSDHIYGLIGLLAAKNITIDYVICPDYVSYTECYKQFKHDIDDYNVIYPHVGQTFQIGDVAASVISPASSDYSDDNGYSVGVLFHCGDVSFLIDGDATEESEIDMLETGENLNADILVVPHHGSKYSSSTDWLNAISPTVGIISVGENNSYFHPHAETLTRLLNCGVKMLYRTDLQGTVTVIGNDSDYTISTEKLCEPSLLWKQGAGSEVTKKNDTAFGLDEDATLEDFYIGNTKSKKFHRPSCEQLPIEKNRVIFATRDEALTAGYLPCGTCKP